MGASNAYVYLHSSSHRRSHLAVCLSGTKTGGKYDHFLWHSIEAENLSLLPATTGAFLGEPTDLDHG